MGVATTSAHVLDDLDEFVHLVALAPGEGDELLRTSWVASRQPWSVYLRDWVQKEHLHAATTLLGLLDARFNRVHHADGPYFFPDLAHATENDELAAIEAGEIRATRVDYVGRLR